MRSNSFINLLKFPFLFVYFVIKSILQAAGVKKPPSPEVALSIMAVCVLVWIGWGQWQEYRIRAEAESADPGVQFVPSTSSESVMSVTALESAIVYYYQKFKREPNSWEDLRDSGVIRGIPEPEDGFNYSLDREYPRLTKVPVTVKSNTSTNSP